MPLKPVNVIHEVFLKLSETHLIDWIQFSLLQNSISESQILHLEIVLMTHDIDAFIAFESMQK